MPPPAAAGFQRATLEVEGDPDPIECWFNPREYAISRSNNWKVEGKPGMKLPVVQFGGPQPRELSLDLLFDASDLVDDSADSKRSVAAVTARLFGLMEVRPAPSGEKQNGQPPTVRFRWGETSSFAAVAKQLSVQYTLFRPNGTPIRAQAKLSLVQVEPAVGEKTSASAARGQNPTTRGIPIGSHRVRPGDSVQSIAYASYGDPTAWRRVAEANGIEDPTRLEPGVVLAIPRPEG